MCINAAAGAAAAATGAHVEGSPITAVVLRAGGLGGVIKSALLNGPVVVALMIPSIYVQIPILLVASVAWALPATVLTVLVISRCLLYSSEF
jgi:hypothetical protein